MTYYEQLVKHASAAMKKRPRSVIALDAESFDVMSAGNDVSKVAAATRTAMKAGRTPVIVQKPRKTETWVL